MAYIAQFLNNSETAIRFFSIEFSKDYFSLAYSNNLYVLDYSDVVDISETDEFFKMETKKNNFTFDIINQKFTIQ